MKSSLPKVQQHHCEANGTDGERKEVRGLIFFSGCELIQWKGKPAFDTLTPQYESELFEYFGRETTIRESFGINS